LYIRRQATTVGLQVPLFWDEKPEKERLLAADDEVAQLIKLRAAHARQEQILSNATTLNKTKEELSTITQEDQAMQQKLFDAALSNPSLSNQ